MFALTNVRADRQVRLAGTFVALALTFSVGCVGEVTGSPRGNRRSDVPIDIDIPADGFGPSGVRRLTQREVQAAVRDLYGVDATPMLAALPLDLRDEARTGSPFDNDYTLQGTDRGAIDGFHSFAESVAATVVADLDGRAALVGCVPTAPGDRSCFRSFLERAARRALRRRLDAAELDAYTDALVPHAERAGDFFVAVELALRVLLQHVEFLHRVEIGTPVADPGGLHRLSDLEVASRLAFLLWGSVPDDELLDAAEAGQLGSTDGLRFHALRLLSDPRAAAQVSTFHALWMGYGSASPTPGSLQADFRAETDALVTRVALQDTGNWSDLFSAEDSFLTPRLAEHYGLPPIAEPQWALTGRGGGILAHASFLAIDTRGVEPSPVFRGRNIIRRLLCRTIPAPPTDDPTVNTDLPPGNPGDCLSVRYDLHTRPGCMACHRQMDPIGFGLQRYDSEGRYRLTDSGRSDCAIAGEGAVTGLGGFSGPGELGALLLASGEVQACAARQYYRFAMGRSERPADEPAIAALSHVLETENDFVLMVLTLVTSDAFRYRTPDNVVP